MIFKKIHSLICCSIILYSSFVFGQKGGMDPSKMLVGRLYGKVVDESGAGVAYATVQLNGKTMSKATGTLIDTIYGGQLTEENGDFNLERLPIIGEFNLNISYLGYVTINQKVDFGIKMPKPGGAPPQGGFGGMPDTEKDLGNIRLEVEAAALKQVEVTARASTTTLSLDRKSYKVDKDLTTAGGTAQDALKNVPSLTVDVDGNVSLRNGQPQIFIDGKPTTLSLDQIPAASIENVEVITNPSSKFDAGGGTAGIVNIVLKKENRLGYNGNVRLGADSREGYNLGADINARGSKINFFASVNHNRMKGKTTGETVRHNLFGSPLSDLNQTSTNLMAGRFTNGRIGFDYLADNRNTITLSANLVRGVFNPMDVFNNTTSLLYDSTTTRTSYSRYSDINRNFRNLGLSAQYKHLYPTKGKELTADIAYNGVKFVGASDYDTKYDTDYETLERQRAEGRGSFITLQSDFVSPINDQSKWETGIKATLRTNQSDNMNSYFDDENQVWQARTQLTDHYKFVDNVYAAYAQASTQWGKWGVQAGLRAESSYYKGSLTDRDSSFVIAYPLSLFPSVFLSRKLNESSQFQFSYTRRVIRPNFFQTMPFTDFSDSLNLRRGNTALIPEFTNSLEASFQKIYNQGHNLLVSLYFKHSINTITTYQFKEFNDELGKEIIITGYANGKSAYAYGLEVTVKNNFFKRLDLTTNINVAQSALNASNVEQELSLSRATAVIKETVLLSMGKGFAFQVNGEYKTRASFTPITNNDPFRGGPGAQPSLNTAQGYTKPFWYMDVSLSKNLMNNNATITLSVQDVFKTRKFGSYTETDFFNQDTFRINNPQLVRLNFSYKFGKMDLSLFKRKNTRMTNQGGDMMGGS